MQKIVWSSKTGEILEDKGRDFARIKTPKGWRSLARQHFLEDGQKRLEGKCFLLSLKLALTKPDQYWYCEGIAHNLPHAWVALKEYDVDWCLDLSWLFYTTKYGYHEHDDMRYFGVRFSIRDVKTFILNRLEKLGPNSTSLSMLKYPNETSHLIQ